MKVKTAEKRQNIIDIAAEIFRESGFEGTSMSAICARVGGSKATIYNYFPSKEALFFEIMFQSAETEFDAVLAALDPQAEDLVESLQRFGIQFLSFLYSPQIQGQRRLAISASGRSDLGRQMYERGVMRSERLIADFLQGAMERGKLRPADPLVAARHLASLLQAELLDRFLCQVLGELDPEEIEAVTGRAVAVFLAAYGADGGGELR